MAFLFALGSFIEVSSMTGVRGYFSLRILPYSEKSVILFLIALSVALGTVFSTPIPAFLTAYAVFPIGWLANPVVVTGVSAALSAVPLVSMHSSLFSETERVLGYEKAKGKDQALATLAMVILVLAFGVFFVMAGDGVLSLLNF